MPLPISREAYCAWCGTYTELTYIISGRPVLCTPCIDSWSAARTAEWRAISGYEDWYEVSNRGEVRSLDRWVPSVNQWGPFLKLCRGKVLQQHPNGSGYLFVTLSRDGVHQPCQVHQLVLEAFAGPCPAGEEARHGPGGKHDNRWPENLSYATHRINIQDQVRDGTRPLGSSRAHARLTEAIVLACRARHAAGETQRALAQEFGVSNQSMSKAITGQTWRHI